MAATRTPIDFTLMFATHDAFRRDLARFLAACSAGRAAGPEVRAGWANFTAQLHVHHTVEDEVLWPRLRQAVSGRPDDVAVVDAMEAEHAQLGPVLATVDAALADPTADPTATVEALAATVEAHMAHEESVALPLVQYALTQADWRAFAGGMRRAQGVKGAAAYLPWVLDGLEPADQDRVLGLMPAPVRVVNRLVWEARHRRRNLWGA